MKIITFTTLIESILLYGRESWTLTQTQAKRLDGTYTRMLRKVLNKSWKDHGKILNSVLYGQLPSLTSKIRGRRLELAGHLYRHKDEEIGGEVLFWIPSHGKRSQGRPAYTYVDQLVQDKGHTEEDIKNLMLDRKLWRGVVYSRRNKPI